MLYSVEFRIGSLLDLVSCSYYVVGLAHFRGNASISNLIMVLSSFQPNKLSSQFCIRVQLKNQKVSIRRPSRQLQQK